MAERGKDARERLARFLPVVVVCGVVAMLYALCVVCHCLPMLQFEVPFEQRDRGAIATGVFHLFLIHVGTGMVLWSFYKTFSTDPGRIPDTQEWRTQPRANVVHERKSDGGARYCQGCSLYKPDRCHHSSSTNRCVLKMDHYCHWVANDVGFFNYKFFVLTLLYSCLVLIFLCITLVSTPRNFIVDSNVGFVKVFFTVLGTALSFFLLALVLPFFIFHVWLVITNSTTIEFCEKRRAGREHPYDLGLAGNLKQALGDQPLLWLIPVGGPSGNGLEFPRRHNAVLIFL